MSLEVSIRKRFPTFSLDAAFSCESGETLALLGASGSGKTLTLSCIAGVARPDGGRIVLDGRVLYDSEAGICLPPQKRMVGLLFQSYALFPNMTAEDNILCGLCRVKGRAAKRERLAELIKTLRLSGMERLYPRELSGGQQQRVALARLLASEPRLLMLDEPFSALDEALKWELEQELLEILSRLSVPVIYVTHDMREVRRLCGRVCVLDNGSAQEPQTPSELFQYPRTMAAARLSGCENVLEAERIDAHTVYVKDINARLKCTRDISGDMRGVAVRAEAIHIGAGEETLKCELLRVADDGGRLIAVLRAEGARATLKAEIKRDALAMYTVGDIIELSVPPKAVNPLDA